MTEEGKEAHETATDIQQIKVYASAFTFSRK